MQLRAKRLFVIAAMATIFLSACSGSGRQNAAGQTAVPGHAAGASDLLATVKQRGKLLISTDANYEPQSYKAPDGTWHGFDIDVGREIARRLGVQAQFMDISFDVVTGGSWNGRWDMNVNSMTMTRDRERVLYFSTPYYYVPASFVVHKLSSAKSIDDLGGKRVGVGTATTYQAYLEGHLTLTGEKILQPAPPARAVPYDTDQLALQDLALGDGVRLDGVLTSLLSVRHQVKQGRPIKPLGDPVFYEDAAIAIDKNSPLDPKSFYRAVENAVVAMHNDGTLGKLSIAYYGIDLSRKP